MANETKRAQGGAAKAATIRPRSDGGWEVDLSDRPAGWPLAKATVSRERLVAFLDRHGYACIFAAEGR